MSAATVEPIEGHNRQIGAALWALGDTRRRTLEAVAGLADSQVDALATPLGNTIGTTLYHIAAIEADWLYADILLEDYPGWLTDVFTFDVREEDGRLTPVLGFSLEDHLARLATERSHFLADIGRLDPDRFTVANDLEQPSSPEWVFHHLSQHEAEHRGQIQSIRTALAGTGREP